MTVVAIVLAYFVVGVLYARSQYLPIYQKQLARKRRNDPERCIEDLNQKYARENTNFSVSWRVPAWPYAMIYDLIAGPFGRWFTKPVADRQAYAAQLRADATAWERKRWTGTPAEREMAAELARICRERAQEVDL